MDGKDFQLLAALGENARQSLQAQGRRVGLSAPAVRERLMRLEERGILQGYWVSIDPALFGRENLLVYFEPDWSREDAVRALAGPAVAWAAWKVDGGLTLQLWPKDAKRALAEIARFMGRAPGWHGVSRSGWSGALGRADFQVLDLLIDEPLAPVGDLAGRLRWSPKTVRRRIEGLTRAEAIYIVARLGQGADPGDLVFDLSVSGTVPLADVRRLIRDVALIHEVDDPPRKYLFCHAASLAELTEATHRLRKLAGVVKVEVSLNRELIIGRDFHHELVRAEAEGGRSRAAR